MTCRICLEDGDSGELLSVCNCSGSCGQVHQKCIEEWIDVSHKTQCEICQSPYTIEYAFKYRNTPSPFIETHPCIVFATVTSAFVHGGIIALESWRGSSFIFDMLMLCILFNAYHVTLWCIAVNFDVHTGIVSGMWLLSFVVGVTLISLVAGIYNIDLFLALLFNIVVAGVGVLAPCFYLD